MSRQNKIPITTYFNDCGLYPKRELFKPATLDLLDRGKITVDGLVRTIIKRVKSLYDAPGPLTDIDANRPCPFKGSSVGTSWDSDDRASWKQEGMRWQRVHEGTHPKCHSNDRLHAQAWWRDAIGRYPGICGAWFPPETMKKFAATMEVYKPVLRIVLDGKVMLLALNRNIALSHGCIWGLSTGNTWWTLKSEGIVCATIGMSWAELSRILAGAINNK